MEATEWIDCHEAAGLLIDALSGCSTQGRDDERAAVVFHNALLSGELAASFKDGSQYIPIPKAAFASLRVVRDGLFSGLFEIDPLWPDEWQRWNDAHWFTSRRDFADWLESNGQVAQGKRSTGVLPPDADEPQPITKRPPSDTARIPISEALSFVAFGMALPAKRLARALQWERLCGGDLNEAQNQLEDALAKLCQAGADGQVAFFGKPVDRLGGLALTDHIKSIQLEDYRQFLVGHDLLLVGTGLATRYETPNRVVPGTNGGPNFGQPHFASVKVSRAELLRCFPPDVDVTGAMLPPSGFKPSNARAPAFKSARPPTDDAILAMADDMKSRGMTGYEIASKMRLEPGFADVATRDVRQLIKGRWKGGRPKEK